jgi:hypothetical protein
MVAPAGDQTHSPADGDKKDLSSSELPSTHACRK